jgi:hypothetical protein
MSTPLPGVFRGSIKIHPVVDLKLDPRNINGFEVKSEGVGYLAAQLKARDAWQQFLSQDFIDALEELSWDVLWELLVAVQFEPSTGVQGEPEHDGQKMVMMFVHETVSGDGGNLKVGVQPFQGFDLLQRIRDHAITEYLAAGNVDRAASLSRDATLLLSLEHFFKGLLSPQYALAEFYSVVETIENRIGGRREIYKLIPRAEIDKITSTANKPQLDQRHAPLDATMIYPLPVNAISDAASVAKRLIIEYSKRVV